MKEDLKTAERQVGEIISRLQAVRGEIQKVIIGQEETLDQLLITFLAGGHGLLEGVPGLAKTLMIRTLAEAIDLIAVGKGIVAARIRREKIGGVARGEIEHTYIIVVMRSQAGIIAP